MKYHTIAKILALILVCNLIACVSQKKYTDLLIEKGALEKKYSNLLEVRDKLDICKSDRTALENKLKKSEDDFEELTAKYEDLKTQHASMSEAYDKQVLQNEAILSSASSSNQALHEQLSQKESELDEKSKQLKSLETLLAQKENNINTIMQDLDERESRINDLNDLLNQKDAIMHRLQASLNEALMGFSKSDLSVYQKDGKIYVSMSQNLLFKTGSDQLDEKGKSALVKLSGVLTENPDVEINVEGHTDNEGSENFNWDLSVKRATSVVKVLTAQKVPADQIVASGRGEHHPVATNDNTEGKSQNRRTEIILSPKLDELFKIINQ